MMPPGAIGAASKLRGKQKDDPKVPDRRSGSRAEPERIRVNGG
jgi:hypothetical protein